MKSQEIKWLLREKYNGEKSEAFFADCKRLALGEPLAYVIGWTPFLDTKIYLDSHSLIPRPETEHWAKEAIAVIRGGATLPLGFATHPPRILDLCAGSGCVGVAVAKAVPTALVDFAEIDEAHLPTITKNITTNNIDPSRTRVIHSNLFSALSDTQYDLILSNPPYIDEHQHQAEQSVTDHEPYLALFGGHKGLEVVAKIIAEAPVHLAPGGQLWIEHDPAQSPAIKELGAAAHLAVTTHTDQYDIERYSTLVVQ